MSNRDPFPLLLVGVYVLLFLEEPMCAIALLFVWAFGLFYNFECMVEAQARGELLEWSRQQPS